MEFIQKQATINAANLANGNDGEAIFMKAKQSRKNTPNYTSNASSGPDQTLDTSSFGKTLVVETINQKTVLNNVSKRKKKRRKKHQKNKEKNIINEAQQTIGNSSKSICEAELETPVNKDTTVINQDTDKGFNSPSYSNNTPNFSNFDNSQTKVSNKSILHNNGGSSQGKTKPKIHNVEDVHTKIIDKELVNWEHFALIVEEYYLTVNT